MPTPADFDRVIFVGVIHTDKDSVERVRSTIVQFRPDVVAVELDRARYQQLQSLMTSEKQGDIPPAGNAVEVLMQQIASLESVLGDITGSIAGEEMMTAIEEGRKVSAKIALVDRPIHLTIQALQQVPLDEIYKMMQFMSDTSGDIKDSGILKLMEQLRVDSTVHEVIEEFRREFPHITRVLIDERDEYVAKALETILDDVKGKIVVVLGNGHIRGVKAALERRLRGVGDAS